jgi:hypothetical protein
LRSAHARRYLNTTVSNFIEEVNQNNTQKWLYQ